MPQLLTDLGKNPSSRNFFRAPSSFRRSSTAEWRAEKTPGREWGAGAGGLALLLTRWPFSFFYCGGRHALSAMTVASICSHECGVWTHSATGGRREELRACEVFHDLKEKKTSDIKIMST